MAADDLFFEFDAALFKLKGQFRAPQGNGCIKLLFKLVQFFDEVCNMLVHGADAFKQSSRGRIGVAKIREADSRRF